MTTIGLLVALPGEKRTLTNARIKPGRFVHLNKNTLVCFSGIGPENATAGAVNLIKQGCNVLISWGCAAAIQPDLQSGDLVIPENLLSATGESWDIDNQWRRTLIHRLSGNQIIHSGSITESLRLVETAAEKRALRNSTGATALDMESAAIARCAARHKIPAVAIRAIADSASMDLPKPVAIAMDKNGNVRLLPLLVAIARFPVSLPGLIQLGFSFRAAQRRLQHTARKLEYNFSAAANPHFSSE